MERGTGNGEMREQGKPLLRLPPCQALRLAIHAAASSSPRAHLLERQDAVGIGRHGVARGCQGCHRLQRRRCRSCTSNCRCCSSSCRERDGVIGDIPEGLRAVGGICLSLSGPSVLPKVAKDSHGAPGTFLVPSSGWPDAGRSLVVPAGEGCGQEIRGRCRCLPYDSLRPSKPCGQ